MRNPFTTLMLTLLCLLAFAAAWPAKAQDKEKQKSASVTLSEPEKARWKQFDEVEQSAVSDFDAALNQALNVKLEAAKAVEVLGQLQMANARLGLVRSARREFLSELRLKHACADCTVSEDGKSLLRSRGE